MTLQLLRRALVCSITVLFVIAAVPRSAWAQHTEGRVNVTVVDPQGAVVPGTELRLVDPASGDTRVGKTTDAGAYSFPNLSVGNYRLEVNRTGFAPQQIPNVVVQATKSTDIQIKLAVGTQVTTVQVESATPVLETSTNAIGSVIDPKQVQTLPLAGRNLTQLARLSPGYVGAGSTGMWNGEPTYAQGNNVDGAVGSPSRMKFGGNQSSSIQPRVENMEEMTIQTDQMDQNQGFGQAATQVGFVTKRGTNAFHGQVYEDFRNSWLNANSWSSNSRGLKRAQLILNDFGGSVGGPVIKDKLFFFASLATSRQPGSASNTTWILSPAAQASNFTYVAGGVSHTVNLFQVAGAYNANNGTNIPTAVNGTIAAQQAKINKSLALGTVTGTADPVLNNINFLTPQPITQWYPTLRMDYNMSSKLRMNLALNRTLRTSPGDTLPSFPGADLAPVTQAGNKSDAATASYGLDWTISPTLINQLKVGWLYNASFFAYNSNHGYTQYPFEWNWALTPTNTPQMSGQVYPRPINTYYPNFNVADTLGWQLKSHNLSFGYNFVREHDHYWNGPEGIGTINFGLAGGDPALEALQDTGTYQPLPGASTSQQTEAQNLYAQLTGRISSVTGLYPFSVKNQDYFHGIGSFALNEVASSWGLFAQDSWKVRPNLTVNYGLRWDFTGDDYDLTSEYHNSGQSSIFGPTAPGDLFKPGALNGNLNPTIESRPHAYNGWNVSPQPSFGFAWNPKKEGGILGALLGDESTVFRGGYSLRRFTIPYQYVWNYASTCGSFYYQNFALNSSNIVAPGNYTPGSLALGDSLPGYAITPAGFQKVAPESQFTFTSGAGGSCGINVTGIKPDIAQPYIQSWTFGIQRKLGNSRVLEIRYNGNRGLKEWVALNTNEVNIFENGFLKEFQNAQNNLRINGGNSFANSNPAAGTVPLPIMQAAFNGVSAANGFGGSTFITYLNTGQAGAFAGRLTSAAGAAPYFCNLVGVAFTPCATNLHLTGAGAGYPINFFQANPYAARTGNSAGNTAYMSDSGYSNYHALQVDLRQQAWHGMQFDANYTWSKTLGTLAGNSGNDWLGNYTTFSLRNLRSSYMPATYDVHHVVHLNATADLPFGHGKAFANNSAVLDKIIGGWNVGTIATIESGFPFRITGGYSTYNTQADGGLVLKGVTPSQLQDAVGVHRIPGATFVTLIDPKYLAVSNPSCLQQWVSGCSISGTNTAYIDSNTTPGTYNQGLTLYGPHGFFQDIAVTKNVPIGERFRFNLQGVFLNAWNHPVFGNGANPISGNPRSSGFATATGATSSPTSNIGARQVELRANFIF
jgi:hypothetical protein